MDMGYDEVVNEVERYDLAFKRTRTMIKLSLEHGWMKEDFETAFQ